MNSFFSRLRLVGIFLLATAAIVAQADLSKEETRELKYLRQQYQQVQIEMKQLESAANENLQKSEVKMELQLKLNDISQDIRQLEAGRADKAPGFSYGNSIAPSRGTRLQSLIRAFEGQGVTRVRTRIQELVLSDNSQSEVQKILIDRYHFSPKESQNIATEIIGLRIQKPHGPEAAKCSTCDYDKKPHSEPESCTTCEYQGQSK